MEYYRQTWEHLSAEDDRDHVHINGQVYALTRRAEDNGLFEPVKRLAWDEIQRTRASKGTWPDKVSVSVGIEVE